MRVSTAEVLCFTYQNSVLEVSLGFGKVVEFGFSNTKKFFIIVRALKKKWRL